MIMDITATSPFSIAEYRCDKDKLTLVLKTNNSYHVFTIYLIEVLINNFVQYTFTHGIYQDNIIKESYVKTFIASPDNVLGFYIDNIQLTHTAGDCALSQLLGLKIVHNTFISGNKCEYIKNKTIVTKSHIKWAFLVDDNRLLEMGIEYEDFMDTFETA
jgi:hypothetical protein